MQMHLLGCYALSEKEAIFLSTKEAWWTHQVLGNVFVNRFIAIVLQRASGQMRQYKTFK
jgi:hypothetical protein